MLRGPGDLVSRSKWSYSNDVPTYNLLTMSPGPPSSSGVLGFKVWVSGVLGSGFRMWGLGFRVLGI